MRNQLTKCASRNPFAFGINDVRTYVDFNPNGPMISNMRKNDEYYSKDGSCELFGRNVQAELVVCKSVQPSFK